MPHFDGGAITQSLTIRLYDSLPAKVVERIREGLKEEMRLDPLKAKIREQLLFEKCLNKGFGCCLLRHDGVAEVVERAFLHFHELRYSLHSWCVMPNHAHVLFTPREQWALGSIVHSWKSYSTHRINAIVGRKGNLWQEDYFDRFMRDEAHFHSTLSYIHSNPVKAGLCSAETDWQFSSAKYWAEENAGETPALRREDMNT